VTFTENAGAQQGTAAIRCVDEPINFGIVLNYFGAEKTKRCIESLLDQKLAALFHDPAFNPHREQNTRML